MRAILTYHSIDSSGSVISVDPRTFRRHAEWISGGPARAVTVDELLAAPADEDCIAVAFDDAFENFDTAAWPILRDLGVPATVFVVSGRTGGDNSWDGRAQPGIPTLPLLDWDRLGRLAEEGVKIGSHTRSHPHLDRVDAARLADEVSGSAEDIRERLGAAPAGFAYPYGDVDAEAERVVAEVYAWACTTELATVGRESRPYRLPRLDAFYYRDPGRLEAWGSGTFRARLGVRRAAREARGWLAAMGAS